MTGVHCLHYAHNVRFAGEDYQLQAFAYYSMCLKSIERKLRNASIVVQYRKT